MELVCSLYFGARSLANYTCILIQLLCENFSWWMFDTCTCSLHMYCNQVVPVQPQLAPILKFASGLKFYFSNLHFLSFENSFHNNRDAIHCLSQYNPNPEERMKQNIVDTALCGPLLYKSPVYLIMCGWVEYLTPIFWENLYCNAWLDGKI